MSNTDSSGSGRTGWTAADFRLRADNQRGRPIGEAWRDHGDHLLNPLTLAEIEAMALKEAAVLVPVVDHPDGASVLLTQRTDSLRKHSGQIAFPGGKIDPEDRTPEQAALREAKEEIGLDAGHIETIGRLPVYLAASGYRITPVLSVVQPGFCLALNPSEVADVFEVPLAFLMDPNNHRQDSAIWRGAERHFYRMPYGERMIWGVTASILRTLYERLYAW